MTTRAHLYPTNTRMRASFHDARQFAEQLGAWVNVAEATIQLGESTLRFFVVGDDRDLQRLFGCEWETMTNHGVPADLLRRLVCRVRPTLEPAR